MRRKPGKPGELLLDDEPDAGPEAAPEAAPEVGPEEPLLPGAGLGGLGGGLGGLHMGLEADEAGLEDAPAAAPPVSDVRRLHELNQNAKGMLIQVREALTMLKKKYKPEDSLDEDENFEGYYRTMKELFDEIAEGIQTKDRFTIEHQTGALQMKLHQLTRKVILKEEAKIEQNKSPNTELLNHFRMLQSDAPSNRKTLNEWVKERLVDTASPEQTKADLIHALKSYIEIRSKEKKWFSGFNKKEKLEGAQAMIDFLEGKHGVSMTLKQLKAVTSDDLGKIISKFQSVVPEVDLNEETNRWELSEKVNPELTVGADDDIDLDAEADYVPPVLRM